MGVVGRWRGQVGQTSIHVPDGVLSSVCFQNVVDGCWRPLLAGTRRNRFGIEPISDLPITSRKAGITRRRAAKKGSQLAIAALGKSG
jgi:hypothetical protein